MHKGKIMLDPKMCIYTQKTMDKMTLGILWFIPIYWITEQDIFHFQFLCFGWPRKSHDFAMQHVLLGKLAISAALHCPVST